MEDYANARGCAYLSANVGAIFRATIAGSAVPSSRDCGPPSSLVLLSFLKRALLTFYARRIMKRLMRSLPFLSISIAVLLSVVGTAFAQPGRERSTKKALAAAKQSARAARVFD